MMCLGWKPQMDCTLVELTPPLGCPDITWFWVGLGVVAVGMMTGNKKESRKQQ